MISDNENLQNPMCLIVLLLFFYNDGFDIK